MNKLTRILRGVGSRLGLSTINQKPSTAIDSGILTGTDLTAFNPSMLWQPVTPDTAKYILQNAAAGDLSSQHQLFSLMEDSWDRLSKGLNEIKRAVKRTSWVIGACECEDPNAEDNKPSDLAEEKACLIRRSLKGWKPKPGRMENNFEDFIYDALDAMGKGVSIQELHWDRTPDGVWLPCAAHLLGPGQYGWNREGNELGLTGANTWQSFPENRFIVGTWKARSGAPISTAMLRPLVPYWLGITYGWQWLMSNAQIFGVPFRWATYDRSRPELKAQLSAMLENLGSAGWAAFPEGVQLEFKEAVTSARDNPQVILMELANQACDLLILGQELSSTSKAAGLGSGSSDLHGDVRKDVLHHACWWMADVIGYQLIPAVLRCNYGNAEDCPTISPDLSSDPDPLALANRDEVLMRNGVKMPAHWFYERHGIPQPQEGEETVGGSASVTPGMPLAKMSDQSDASDKSDSPPTLSAADSQQVAADLLDAQRSGLDPLRSVFQELDDAINNQELTDAQVLDAVEAIAKRLPELHLDCSAMADELYAHLTQAAIKGLNESTAAKL